MHALHDSQVEHFYRLARQLPPTGKQTRREPKPVTLSMNLPENCFVVSCGRWPLDGHISPSISKPIR